MHLPSLSGMEPCGIPPIAKQMRPGMHAHHIGPPPGISDEECSTVEALVGYVGGYSAYIDYWKPTEEQLAMLNAGGVIEFIQYSSQMVMHSVNIWKDPT